MILLAVILNVVTLLYIMLYTRNGASFKWNASMLAYLLAAVSGLNIIRVFTPLIEVLPYTSIELLWQGVVCFLVVINRGNVASLIPQHKKVHL